MATEMENIIAETESMNQRIEAMRLEIRDRYRKFTRMFDAFQSFEQLRLYEPGHEYQMAKGVYVTPRETTEDHVELYMVLEVGSALEKKVFDCAMRGQVQSGEIDFEGERVSKGSDFSVAAFEVFSIRAVKRSVLIIHAIQTF